MLSGLKFIPRDQIGTALDDGLGGSVSEGKNSGRRKEKDRKKKKRTSHNSSDEEDLERIKNGSRKKKKWYSSEEDLTPYSDNNSGKDSYRDEKKHKKKKTRRRRNDYASGDSSSNSETENDENYVRKEDRHTRGGNRAQAKKNKERGGEKDNIEKNLHDDDIIRRDMGLEWMLRPKDDTERKSVAVSDHEPEEPQVEEIKKVNPRELNPYLKDDGSGYPEDADGTKSDVNHHLSSSVVGDGGASWRLKALKRAKEQAAREGRKLDDVVEERWGSLGQLAVSVASRPAAPSHAHLHATRNRRRELTGEQLASENRSERVTEKDVSVRHADMKVPKLHDSLSWGKRKRQAVSTKDADLISSAMSSLNKFANDGSFMREVMHQKSDDSGGSFARRDRKVESERVSSAPSTSSESKKSGEDYAAVNTALSANQLAAKVMQLRMKGKHDEAEKLMKEADKMKAEHDSVDETKKSQDDGGSRYVKHDMTVRQKKKEEDADSYLAQQIVQNKLYSISGGADDEYDYDGAPRRKIRKKEGNDHKSTQKASFANRILTQQERCQYCFESPKRPRHLIVAIANFTYVMLPQWQPVVPGHCCILPMQHESATRAIDNNVWDELRNFKKCLIMMFAKQEKDVVFLETVMGLAQQRRHCLVECIPLPQDIAKAAPLYFKKAIDEAEDEWSQHNAKKLIDTSEKGLRGSIPKDFPYFHVEFGLKKGFVHVIDDEKTFKINFGLNVIRGMLRLPVEDMHRRRQNESTETQRQAVASFARDWEPFDWTKQLG